MLTLEAVEQPFQVLDYNGQVVGPLPEGVNQEQSLRWYRAMWLTRNFSNKLVALQRQGKATTWIPSQGQEACAVGLATALEPQDWLAASPREMGGYLFKGVKPAAIAYFVRGYPPPRALFDESTRCLPFTIVIGTQTPHAVGLAMAARIRGDRAVSVVAVGDGASSEGDFNESLNFAGVYQAPAVIVVINNGWSISVPRSKQSAATTLAQRGPAFGLPSHRVDGNDILAMHSVMQEAVNRARMGGGPTLIEAITYRMSAHSTADDPTRYQPAEELSYWQERDPLKRFRQFLLKRNWLDEAHDQQIQIEVDREITEQVELAYSLPVPAPAALFSHVYATPSLRLQRQRDQIGKD